LGKQFDKVALEAKALDQRMGGLYEDMGHILSRYYKIGEISEDQMKERLGMNESKEDCGCGCNETEGGCNESVNEAIKYDKEGFVTKLENEAGNIVKSINLDGNSFSLKGKRYVNKKGGKDLHKSHLGIDEVIIKEEENESLNEGTDIYINNRIQITKFSGGKDGKLIQINAPKVQGSGDHIIMKIDDFKKMLKKSSNLLKQVQESLNEEPVAVSTRNDDGSITTTIKEVTDLNEQETALYEFGQKVETLMEKNCPTNPSKWSSYKSQAKQKFDVYPSAYANGWAAKKYKAAGGGWKKC